VIIISSLQHTQEAQMALTGCHSEESPSLNGTTPEISGQSTPIGQRVLWSLGRKDVTIDFSAEQVVTDTGLLTIRKLDRELGILSEAAARLADPREQKSVTHDAERLLVQQVYQLLGGYFDANDSNVLRNDPLFQTLADVPPDGEQPLASGSTVSRFRYAYTRRQEDLPLDERTIDEERQAANCQRITAINKFLVETFIKTRRAKPKRIIIDLDASDDPVHGQQQLTFWHGYYDQQQYFPLLSFDGESGFPLGAWLRLGKAHASWGAIEALEGIVPALRAAWPDVEIVVRGDAGYGVPELYEYAENNDLKYVIGYTSNAVLKRRTELLLNYTQACADLYDEPLCRFTQFDDYQAESWSRPRRIIAKCEVTAQGGPNRRFVVTNLDDRPEALYHGLYVKRGNYPERSIQELKHGLQMDRLSSHRFFANAFTLQCHVLAYALYVLFREANAEVPEVAKSQLQTVQSKLFKVGALAQVSVRRIWFRISATWPGRELFERVCQAVNDFTSTLGHLWPNRLEQGLQAELGGAVRVLK
jgi:hypothetical protein